VSFDLVTTARRALSLFNPRDFDSTKFQKSTQNLGQIGADRVSMGQHGRRSWSFQGMCHMPKEGKRGERTYA